MTLADIRDVIGSKFKGVSSNTYSHSRKKVLPDSVKDYVVVSTPIRFRDITDYGVRGLMAGAVVIECFAKDLKSGLEDTARLKQMEEAAMEVIDNVSVSEDGFSATLRGCFSAPSDEGFKGFVIILDIIV